MSTTNKARSFLELSLTECYQQYPYVKKNAERHFKTAKILSDASEFPNAVAHLILGTEELIKALALLLEGKKITLREVEKYKKIFYDHKARHSIVKEFFSVWAAFKPFINLKKRKRNENKVVYYLKASAQILSGIEFGLNNYTWWDSADLLKQNCFYVDYKEGLILPNKITNLEYDVAFKHVMAFREDIRILIILIERANEKELNEFKDNIEQANFRALLSGTIKRSSS